MKFQTDVQNWVNGHIAAIDGTVVDFALLSADFSEYLRDKGWLPMPAQCGCCEIVGFTLMPVQMEPPRELEFVPITRRRDILLN